MLWSSGPWDAGFITDYSTDRPWHAASAAGGDGGHSLSLFKRSWWLSYLSGANHLIAEAGGVNLFYQNMTAQGVYSLCQYWAPAIKLGYAEASSVPPKHARAHGSIGMGDVIRCPCLWHQKHTHAVLTWWVS